jgi:hypothetical protein
MGVNDRDSTIEKKITKHLFQYYCGFAATVGSSFARPRIFITWLQLLFWEVSRVEQINYSSNTRCVA